MRQLTADHIRRDRYNAASAKVARQDSRRSMSIYAALPCSLYANKTHHRQSISRSDMREEKRARDIRIPAIKKLRCRPGNLSDDDGSFGVRWTQLRHLVTTPT